MKKIIVLVFCLMWANLAVSQTRFSIEGSFTESTMESDNGPSGIGYNPGFGVGLGVDFFSDSLFQFNLGLDYVQRGGDLGAFYGYDMYGSITSTFHMPLTLDYLVLRPSFGFKSPHSFARPLFLFGPYAAFLLGGQVAWSDGTYSLTASDLNSINRIDAGLSAGMGVEFFSDSMVSPYLRAQYDFGLLFWPKNRTFLVSTGMLFGRRKKHALEPMEDIEGINIADTQGLPEVREWTLELVGKDGLIKKTLKGKGAMPAMLSWKLDSKTGYSLRSSITDSFGAKSISLQPLTSIIQPREIQHSAPLFAQSSDGKGGLRLNTQLERDIPDIRKWKLQIFTKDGSLVKELSAKGLLPRVLSWDGKDAKGVIVLDAGELNYVFTADGGEGMNSEVFGSIAKAIKPREILVKPPSYNPSTKIIVFMPEIKMSVKVKEWILSIKAADGVVIKTLTGKGPLPREFKFDPSKINIKGLDLAARKSGLAYIQYAFNIVKEDGSNEVVSDVLALPASNNARLEESDVLSQGDFRPVAGRELLLLIEPRFISMQASFASSATLLFKLPEGRKTKAWRLAVKLGQEDWTADEGKGTPPACLSWKGTGKNGNPLNASALAGAALRLVMVRAGGEDTALPEAQPMNRSFENCDDSKKMRRVHAAWFSKGESELQSEMMERLDRVADLMKASPSLKLIVQGHCSKEGDENANAKLSKARAQAVRRYLEENQGIDAARLSAVGFSNQMLLDFSGDEDAVRRNRRADVILFK